MSEHDIYPVYSQEWGERFQMALDTYMDGLESALEIAIEEDINAEVETLSGVPYCGCGDCYNRELLLMTTKLVIQGYEAGEVKLHDGSA